MVRRSRAGRSHPAVAAGEVAAGDVAPPRRAGLAGKLKELGLTESLDIGYRLSPRGATVVDTERRARGGRARRRTREPEGTALPRVGPSASRALRAAGVVTLEDVAVRREADRARLSGVGPVAIARLREALTDRGLSFAP